MNNLKINTFEIIYKGIIKNNKSIKTDLLEIPKIPNLYFKDDSRGWYDNKIIDSYYRIRVKLEKLKKIKDNLFLIVELNKNKFENIFIDKYKYKLDKRFLIFKKDKLEIKNFNEFNIFKDDFLKKKNIIDGLTTTFPHFYDIFNINYNEKDKKYFLKLFKTYIEIRNDLLNEDIIKNNHGLMAYNHFFDINEFLELKKKEKQLLENIVKNRRNRNNPNSINYNKYYYPEINKQKDEGNKQKENNEQKKIREEQEEMNKEEKIDDFKNYDAIYSTQINDNSYKSLNKTNINKMLKKINGSIDEYLSVGSNGNLFSILINAIQADYNVIKFLYYYEDPLIYNSCIDLSTKKRIFITKLISNFYEYESSYLYWIKKYITKDSSNLNKIFYNKNTRDLLEFDQFLKEIQI
jgi:hypothetical protein